MFNLKSLPNVVLEFLRIERVFWELVAIAIIRAILRVPAIRMPPKAMAMAERIMISSAIANNLGCTWLKGFDAIEIQPLVRTLQEIVEWFNRPTIDNVENFPLARRLFLHLSSQFANVFEHFGNVFFKCNRFPYEETVTNEWFTLPDDENDRKQPVMVMNVNKEGKKRKCYLSQDGVDDFMKSIIDEDHQVFFHGTRHQYAQDIIEGGIDIKMGARRQDFSNGDGFYLGDDFEEACRWPASRGHPNTAVLVFRVEKTELRDQDKGLDLRNDRTRWQELVSQFRSGKPDLKFVKSLRKCEFIEGPMASMSSKNPNFNHPRQKENTYQLCVRKDRCAEVFDRSLHSVIFFEH